MHISFEGKTDNCEDSKALKEWALEDFKPQDKNKLIPDPLPEVGSDTTSGSGKNLNCFVNSSCSGLCHTI